jgi:cell division protein FtsZ
MAMMGSAKAAGTDRARMAAEQAVACPLLEDIDIADARGVLVNISASKSLFQLQEMYDVMDVIKAFAAESATVIAGTVYDEALADELRVTIVANRLGQNQRAGAAEAAAGCAGDRHGWRHGAGRSQLR